MEWQAAPNWYKYFENEMNREIIQTKQKLPHIYLSPCASHVVPNFSYVRKYQSYPITLRSFLGTRNAGSAGAARHGHTHSFILSIRFGSTRQLNEIYGSLSAFVDTI